MMRNQTVHKGNGITRRAILRLIKVNGYMTADGLGRELGISAVAARQHLTGLESEGMVQATPERRGMGRPVHRYTLTEAGDETFTRTYDLYAAGLLADIRIASGPEAVNAFLERQVARLMGDAEPRIAGKSLEARVAELVRIMSDRGFMAESREEEGGGRLLFIEHNCPVRKLVVDNPEICTYELDFIERLLGPGVQVERIKYIPAGDHMCAYRIQMRG